MCSVFFLYSFFRNIHNATECSKRHQKVVTATISPNDTKRAVLNAHCSHPSGHGHSFFCAETFTCMSRKSPCDSRPEETSAASLREIWLPFCTRTADLSPCAPSYSVVTDKKKGDKTHQEHRCKKKKKKDMMWKMHKWLFKQ